MSQRRDIWTIGLLLGLLSVTWSAARAQDNPTPPPAAGNGQTQTPDNGQQTTPTDNGQTQEPVPAYGQAGTAPISENPPLTGLDLPSLEPHAAPLSYLQPGATVSESADSNIANSVGGGTNFRSVSRVLGSLLLNRTWSHYDLALDYVGGAAYYDAPGEGFKNLQQADAEQKVTWKRGEFSVRDSFSYLPEGNFGGAYGSLGSQGIASLGGAGFGIFAEGSLLGALGETPRLMNVSVAEVQETLTPKSAVTATGGYAILHFFGNDIATGTPFIGSSQVSGQVGYNRMLTAKTQVAIAYAYQGFDFTIEGTSFHSQIIELMYGHQISGKMDFMAAAGPQITQINFGGSDTRLGVAGNVRLRYKFPKTMVDLSYQRYLTSGSGIFAGAQTDVARLTAMRPLSRVWNIQTDLGYARNARLQAADAPATSYSYGFAGLAVHRSFGRTLHGYASYQFNELAFDKSYCALASACNRISNRDVITIGLDWIPRPIRLD